MASSDTSQALQDRISRAYTDKTALRIYGGNSKRFYGNPVVGEDLSLAEHSGIVSYEPTELVITARAGTPLNEIETALAAQNQMLGFEPPHFGDKATLGGTIACNLSGPRRSHTGAARDFVLGCRIINGKGEQLKFGGQVMKNVAGYDVSRLMCGAMGTLGVMLEVSLKVLPKPEAEKTLVFELATARALAKLHALGRQAVPLSASSIHGDHLHIRLSGSQAAVTAAKKALGGEEVAEGDRHWLQLREQQHRYFSSDMPLWRISLASNAPVLKLPGKWLYEWGGAQRWLVTDAESTSIRQAAETYNGHASCFRSQNKSEQVFHPLPNNLAGIHKNLKQAFDPAGIFNPGKMYADF